LEDSGRVGSGSTTSSSLSEAESGESENGNRPRASSMRDTPRDQTSDLIVYGAPWIRSGYESAQSHKPEWLAYAHVCASSNKGVCDRVDEFTRDSEITNLDLPLGVCEDIGRFDIYTSA
jgi:hypothetical protein